MDEWRTQSRRGRAVAVRLCLLPRLVAYQAFRVAAWGTRTRPGRLRAVGVRRRGADKREASARDRCHVTRGRAQSTHKCMRDALPWAPTDGRPAPARGRLLDSARSSASACQRHRRTDGNACMRHAERGPPVQPSMTGRLAACRRCSSPHHCHF